MRQVITLGAHIMNQKWSIIIINNNFWKYHQQAKEKQKQNNRFFREQNISNLLQTKPQSPTETLKWYKKEKETLFFFFCSTKKLAQYSLTSSVESSRLVAVKKARIRRPMSRTPWEKGRQTEKKRTDRATQTGKQRRYSHYSSSEQGIWRPNVKFKWQSTQGPHSVMHCVGAYWAIVAV